MIIRFSNNDPAYEGWYMKNKGGFVLNFFKGKEGSAKFNKLHHADCRYLRDSRNVGKRTIVEKVCSNSKEELEEFASHDCQYGWTYCKSCF